MTKKKLSKERIEWFLATKSIFSANDSGQRAEEPLKDEKSPLLRTFTVSWRNEERRPVIPSAGELNYGCW